MITIQKDPFHFRDFTFENILGTSASQEDTYVRSCQAIVESFTRDGEDGCVLCYGQSGSGKSFTMFGDSSSTSSDSSNGLVQHSMRDVFAYSDNCQDANFEVRITVSFYEIYLEKIRDLLAQHDAGHQISSSSYHPHEATSGLCIREVPSRGAYVEGLTEVTVLNFEQALVLIRDMKFKRTSKKRQSNSASSRSHAVLRVKLEHFLPSKPGIFIF
jgi:kinesin family protein 5